MIRRGIGVQSFVSAGGGGTDADAQAFITAAGITDATQQSAINTLVTDLKSYGIWSKMKAIYPFVGGTSSAHKFNLKDPRDLDAAYRLVFSGGITHSSTGVLWNGTNGFGDTKFNCNTNLGQFSSHISYYSRTNSNGTFIDAGAATGTGGGPDPRIAMHIKYSGTGYYDQNDFNNGRLTVNMSSTNSTGLFTMNRTSSTVQKVFRNSSQIGSTNTNTITSLLPTRSVYLGAFNINTVIYTDRQCAFASIGDGLTDTEAANLYTAVQAYQTTLNRNI